MECNTATHKKMTGSVDNRKELAELHAQYPNMFILGPDTTPDQVDGYLGEQGWCPGRKVASLEAAGEVFNMNCTVRVKFADDSSLILKQSRPFVERYPAVEAPFERVNAEARFYSLISSNAGLTEMTPKLIGHDRSSYIIALQDLGKSSDWGKLYAGGAMPLEPAAALGKWLGMLHTMEVTEREGMENTGMKALTRDHVFDLPLQEGGGGVDLEAVCEGLEGEAKVLRGDEEFAKEVAVLRDMYLNSADKPGAVLLHGDFFPASWMDPSSGPPCVIDTEFAHFGVPEFDLGVALGHLTLTNNTPAASALYAAYAAAKPSVSPRLATQYAGVEIMRRMIGLAQLPLSSPELVTLEHKSKMLRLARKMVCTPEVVTF
eukprot:TRINITY_DN382_c0_g3_i4.p1 TRINITY_DN382_c0_g3~~TRINITY_DN382_c0_g3_i4.p1  ORF type:complete len:375 (+),score=69.22 TRINITY_DN382_c0_g3_i4:1140-2264(+)